MAAIRASEVGAKVIVAEEANTVRSGGNPQLSELAEKVRNIRMDYEEDNCTFTGAGN
jgi:hypothetical protein